MKSIIFSTIALLVFNTAKAQFNGHGMGNIQLYFGDMLEQGKWDFDKEYRWSFYLCADDAAKLSETQKELSKAGFTGFEIIPNSVSRREDGAMLSMLVFEKTGVYIPKTLMNDINIFYSLENKYRLSSFDDYGNYELMEEVSGPTTATLNSKSRIF